METGGYRMWPGSRRLSNNFRWRAWRRLISIPTPSASWIWADAPARLIGAALTEALSESGLFDDVGAPGSRFGASHRLDTDLIRLEQVFDAGGSALRLTIRYRLIDQASGESLGSLHHDLTLRSTTDDPQGGVAAANLALRESLQDLFVELPGWIDASG